MHNYKEMTLNFLLNIILYIQSFFLFHSPQTSKKVYLLHYFKAIGSGQLKINADFKSSIACEKMVHYIPYKGKGSHFCLICVYCLNTIYLNC